MARKINKDEFIINASIQLAGGESAYAGGSMNAVRVIANAEELYDALVKEGYIEDPEEKEND